MNEADEDQQQADLHEFFASDRNCQHGHDQYAYHRNHWHDLVQPLESMIDEVMKNEPRQDREEYDLGHAPHHGRHIDLHHFARERLHQQGRQERRKQRRERGHGYRHRDIGLGDKRHDVGGQPARRGAHQHEPGGEPNRQAEAVG